ncbi:MAG: Trk system potassium transporter TrkA [Phycisphaerales bacterium]|nr:Trk system potassium transporter TrkA [Phycisphaerales bacterium]
MHIVIAGAGEVGRHTAAVLADANHEITLIDQATAKLEAVSENLDARTLQGDATRAETLREAGVARCGLFVAATDADQDNLLAASIAKGIGAAQVIARVHHSAYHTGLHFDYAGHFHIDQLICPEYLTSLAIVGVLRDPAVEAVEHFARGKIIMEQVEIGPESEVVGMPLKDLSLPAGFRIGTVNREGRSSVPTGETILEAGEQITLIGTTDVFDKTLPKFRREALRYRKIVIMGGSSISVWLARALDRRFFRIRLYVNERARAEELSAKLPHVTVIDDDPTDPDTFAEDRLAEIDAFVAASGEDEINILAALQARHLGVPRTVAVINRPTYHQMIAGLGIDHVFSPRIIAAREIERLAQRKAVQEIARLDEHGTGIYSIEMGPNVPASGKTLRELELPRGCVLVGVQRGNDVHVPGPNDRLAPGDKLVAIAQEGLVRKLNALFT